MVQLLRVTQPTRSRARTQTWVFLASKPPLSALPATAEGSHRAWAGRTPHISHLPKGQGRGFAWWERHCTLGWRRKGQGIPGSPHSHPHHCAGACWVRGYWYQLQRWGPSLPQPLLGLKEVGSPRTAPQYLSPPLLPRGLFWSLTQGSSPERNLRLLVLSLLALLDRAGGGQAHPAGHGRARWTVFPKSWTWTPSLTRGFHEHREFLGQECP